MLGNAWVYIYTTNCQISIKYICILDTSVAQRDRTSSLCFCVKMPGSETQENKPPAGYPIDTPTTGKKCFPRTKKKGERGFIEGCLFALCCCWICEMCC